MVVKLLPLRHARASIIRSRRKVTALLREPEEHSYDYGFILAVHDLSIGLIRCNVPIICRSPSG